MLPFGLSPKSGVLPTFVILLPSTSTAAFVDGLAAVAVDQPRVQVQGRSVGNE